MCLSWFVSGSARVIERVGSWTSIVFGGRLLDACEGSVYCSKVFIFST